MSYHFVQQCTLSFSFAPQVANRMGPKNACAKENSRFRVALNCFTWRCTVSDSARDASPKVTTVLHEITYCEPYVWFFEVKYPTWFCYKQNAKYPAATFPSHSFLFNNCKVYDHRACDFDERDKLMWQLVLMNREITENYSSADTTSGGWAWTSVDEH